MFAAFIDLDPSRGTLLIIGPSERVYSAALDVFSEDDEDEDAATFTREGLQIMRVDPNDVFIIVQP